MKDKIKYIIGIILLLILLFVSIYTYINIHYDKKGDIKIENNYYEIKFTNVMVKEEDLIVKLSDNSDTLHIEIPNVVNNKEYSFSVDVKNIGNEDVKVKDVLYKNINSNIEEANITVDNTLIENDVIKGGEEKKLNLLVKYNGINIDNLYYNFDINYHFMK